MFRRSRYRHFIVILLAAFLYCEFFIHYLQPLHWYQMECGGNDHTCTKLLLIADPQIQGETAVSAPLSWLLNWDSDRYLSYTFSIAMNYFKPDVLVYLGDLTDEGSIATQQAFQRYVRRLLNIFYTERSVMQVWIPGDNDVGGENERINHPRLKEFADTFSQPDVLKYEPMTKRPKNLVFYKVNRIAYQMPRIPDDYIPNDDDFNILVSHYPLVGTGPFSQKAIKELYADLTFVGHDHLAKIVKSPRDSPYSKTTRRMWHRDKVTDIEFDNKTIYEIFAPTCSYRMGVPNMGYGAAVLEHNYEHLRYQVLWSSGRFPILYFYLYLLTIAIIYLILNFLLRPFCGRRF